jgi:serine/threonine protein kinase
MPQSAMKKLKEDEVKLLASFVDLLDKMLALDPTKRPTPKVSPIEVRRRRRLMISRQDMLNHPFVRSN